MPYLSLKILILVSAVDSVVDPLLLVPSIMLTFITVFSSKYALLPRHLNHRLTSHLRTQSELSVNMWNKRHNKPFICTV
jgi:hypothetical protein